MVLDYIRTGVTIVMSVLQMLLGTLGIGIQPLQGDLQTATEDALVQDVTIMSYNVLVGGIGQKAASKARMQAVASLIEKEEPDSIGLQEVSVKKWLPALTDALPAYDYVGLGRDAKNTGEASPIFYQKAKYTLVDSGTFWLSETPDAPSRGWDAAYNRVCTWAKLQDKTTGFTYVHYNVHMDHLGSRARHESSKLIMQHITENAYHLPVVLSGDFNAKTGSQPYRQITKSGLFDTKKIADTADSGATLHSNGVAVDLLGRPIDHIFVSRQVRKVESYRVIRDQVDGRYPSDHYPIVSQMILANQESVPDVTRIMSFNVLTGGEGEKEVSIRVDRVINTIASAMPDSFGVQEAHLGWISTIKNHLPQYDYVGRARDGVGFDEFSAVFYLKDKYILKDSGTFWISETPEKPSLGWDASVNRVCTWAVLENRETGERYAHYNTHLDHIGTQARAEGVKLMQERAKALSMPVVITGDFNVSEGSEPYQVMVSDTFLDAKITAEETMQGNTFHDFGKTDPAAKPIDFIFYSQADWSAVRYRIMAQEMLDGYASDHYAIYADLQLKS